MRIWKFSLDITDEQTVMIPRGAKLLDIQVQDAAPRLWALCEPTAPREPRRIAIYGTDELIIGDPGEYIATFLLSRGEKVFHAFETRDKSWRR
ncbi:MAG: DUF7352 domain-containing protein [Syntrophales bacterium]